MIGARAIVATEIGMNAAMTKRSASDAVRPIAASSSPATVLAIVG